MSGPLAGLRIVEFAGLGPAPYAAMLLADLGADVLRLERLETRSHASSGEILLRSRTSVALDLKSDAGRELALELSTRADAVIEGFRPGVMERLGLGPGDLLAQNPRLVYGRMTGYGQSGALSQRSGHDINYIAVSGALWPLGRAGERPTPPMNLVGDFGGGSLFLVLGVLAGVWSARETGLGQVVDAAMVDGSASMLAMMHSFINQGFWNEERGTNILDTGAHFYEVYETSDHQFMAVGAIEAKFYEQLLRGLGLESSDLPHQMDRTQWPVMKERLAAVFATKTRDEWTSIFDTLDACVTPVLAPREAPKHPYNTERDVYLSEPVQPAPAPRFSRTPGSIRAVLSVRDALASWGVSEERVVTLERSGVIGEGVVA
ncbi:MAG TPA: CaiB/BaiF CoA-transferase family protein [Acidimicrobiales bacterium]|nr:CaiB/BaiF CoA-transferase family protein [Acidimicrobiales bacterium]